MEIIKPKIIEISPATVDAIRPRKLFFSLHNSHQLTISKGLTADLGKVKGICFGYDDKGVYLWPDPKGFGISLSGTAYQIQSTALVDTLINTVKLTQKMRYYVTLESEGLGIPRYKVMFSAPCSVHQKEDDGLPDGSYKWEAPIQQEA